MDDIARLATRLLVMHKGRLVLDGEPMDIFLHHKNSRPAASMVRPSRRPFLLKEKGIPVPEEAKRPKKP